MRTLVLAVALLAHLAAPSPATGNGANVDWDALASPERLAELRARCWDLGNISTQLDRDAFSHAALLTYECLLSVAVNEFDRYFATELFPVDQFEQRLRQVSEGRAQLVADLYSKHGRCTDCTEVSIRMRSLVRIWTVEFYLSEIWKSYSFGGPG